MGMLDNLRRLADVDGDSVRQAIKAYHGSPHDFDRFDAGKIGTGEGAQAFGHGLYFAGDEGVANEYRRRLSGKEIPESLLLDGVPHHAVWQDAGYPERDGIGYLASMVAMRAGPHKSEYIDSMRRTAESNRLAAVQAFEDAKSWATPTELFEFERQVADAAALETVFRKYKNITPQPAVRPGRTYEVEIGFPENALLDWDAAIGSQPSVFPQDFPDRLAAHQSRVTGSKGRSVSPVDRMAHAAYHTPEKKGSTLYFDLNSRVGPKAAAQLLMDAGIPGIKYWDGQSRSVGAGVRNYVMFPGTEDQIRILRKYGLLPATFAAEGLVNPRQPAESTAPAF